MKTRHTRHNRSIRALALALLMALGASAPARAAGLFDWLTGSSAPSVEASTQVTLPPAQALQATPQATPEAATPAPSAEPVPDARIQDDGLLRVQLRSLNAPEQLHLTLAGVYAVEGDPGFRFDRDARVTLSAAEGSVYLAVSGLTIDMGSSVTLTRHRAEAGAENGLYIEESEKDALYCGDLTVSARDEGGLQAVLSLQIEDYLYGVVAYEMSDSFPIEALKAQAVAARTYAMRRKWQSGGRAYDVADTTADQVYKGFDASYANVIRAVDDTRGVVGLYDGGFASCYYTASNGGQTALPSQIFGSTGDDAYLAMTDDPYDLENPRSLQNELTVTARCEGSAALKGLLEAELGRELSARGYADGEWELDSIASIEPVNPRFEGSRMYDGLTFALRARLLVPVQTPVPAPTDTPAPDAAQPAGSLEPMATLEPVETLSPAGTPEPVVTQAPAGTPESVETQTPAGRDEAVDALAAALMGQPVPTAEPTPEPTEIPKEWVLSEELYSVTLDVYDQIKDGLSLGLNGSDCELISVETRTGADGQAESFTLIMRRFGHGVGMSQRGAQWMAGQYGATWRQILSFYYPGLSFERMNWPETALTDLAALPDSVGAARAKPTPAPTPAPLPPLEAGERYAVVQATSLNVRQQPTTASPALDQLAQGRRVIVSGEADADGWISIRTAELTGFVKAEYLAEE